MFLLMVILCGPGGPAPACVGSHSRWETVRTKGANGVGPVVPCPPPTQAALPDEDGGGGRQGRNRPRLSSGTRPAILGTVREGCSEWLTKMSLCESGRYVHSLLVRKGNLPLPLPVV